MNSSNHPSAGKSLICRSFITATLIALSLTQAHAVTTVLTGTVRDFLSQPGQLVGYTYNPDFENACCGDDKGIVKSTLGLDGKPVYANAGSWSTTGESNFNEWFRDTPGRNVSIPYAITLDDSAQPGVFTYANPEFFPIDGQGLGNGPFSRNFSFTYQISTSFNYSGSGSFTFTGDDDVWVFINNSLVIDLGGVHSADSATVDLSTLGLTAGQNYNLDVFFAERHTGASSFRMDTTLALRQRTVPDTGATLGLMAFAVGALLVGARRVKTV